jgi:hypothetical protein
MRPKIDQLIHVRLTYPSRGTPLNQNKRIPLTAVSLFALGSQNTVEVRKAGPKVHQAISISEGHGGCVLHMLPLMI